MISTLLAKRSRVTALDKPNAERIPFLFRRVRSKIPFSEDLALTYSAVFACVRVISETLALLPWHVLRLAADGSKTLRRAHPVDFLLHSEANPEMSAFSLKEALTGHALLWGNGYAEIERGQGGKIIALWPLAPDRVRIERDERGQLVYLYRGGTGNETVLSAKSMFHVHGPGFDGVSGYSVIRLAKEAVGLGLAAEAFGSTFFGNGVRPSGVYTHPKRLGDKAYRHLKESLAAEHSGFQNVAEPLILEEGVTWQNIGIPPDDAQFLETRKFQTTEIARWFRVPPHKLADLERATFSNIEHQAIEFVTDTILPWIRRWECEANRKLFGVEERRRLFTKMNVNALLRGDVKSRYEAYRIGREGGWLNVDEIREWEDMNPVGGVVGTQYIVPMNFTTPEGLKDQAEAPAKPEVVQEVASDDPLAIAERCRHAIDPPIRLIAQRFLRREMREVGRLAKTFGDDQNGFSEWLQQFYERQARAMIDEFSAIVRSVATIVGCESGHVDSAMALIVGKDIDCHVKDAIAELEDAFDDKRIAETLEARMTNLPGRLSAELTEQTKRIVMLYMREGVSHENGSTTGRSGDAVGDGHRIENRKGQGEVANH